MEVVRLTRRIEDVYVDGAMAKSELESCSAIFPGVRACGRGAARRNGPGGSGWPWVAVSGLNSPIGPPVQASVSPGADTLGSGIFWRWAPRAGSRLYTVPRSLLSMDLCMYVEGGEAWRGT